MPDDLRFAWWRDAIAGLKPPIVIGEPQPGFYQRRLIKGGPFVPVRIYWHGPRDAEGQLIGDEVLICEVDGKRRDAEDEWTWVAGMPITQAEYEFQTKRARWARKHKPGSPHANPRKSIDLRRVPLPTFKKD